MQSKVNSPVGDARKTEATKQDQAAKNPESPAAAGGAAAAGAESAVPSVGTVLEAAEELWPQSLAEDWDAVGLVAGRTTASVKKVVFAVDPTLQVIEDAIERGADLLITHHPLLLKPVNQVAGTSFKGEAITRLIEDSISIAG